MKFICVFIFILGMNTQAQSSAQSFFKLSSPEKWWVIFHPFKAKKALHISRNALKVTDSIGADGVIGQDLNGGRLDAFKHSYWMFSLATELGENPAEKLGIAHEKGNYKAYKKRHLEDGGIPDKISSDMDLFNNHIGILIVRESNTNTHKIQFIIEKIKKGHLKIVKKDSNGNYLNCQGDMIPPESLVGKWKNDKCLVDSNQN